MTKQILITYEESQENMLLTFFKAFKIRTSKPHFSESIPQTAEEKGVTIETLLTRMKDIHWSEEDIQAMEEARIKDWKIEEW